MTPEKEYEEACLKAVRDGARESFTLKDDATVIHDVRLEGSHPETRLVVDIQRFDRRGELDWHLWGDDFGTSPPGSPPYPPAGVLQDVLVQLYEFQ